MSAERLPFPDSSPPRSQDETAAPETGDTDARPPAVLQFRTHARSWPAIIGGLVAVGVLCWAASSSRDPELRPVQNGRRFSHAERRHAEQALRTAGIHPVRAAGNQLHVAPDTLAAADQALAHAADQAASSSGQWQTASSLLDQFATGRRQQQAESAARAAQVARLLEQQPGVASAEIVWDEEPRVGRRQSPRVRATVFLKPEPGWAIGLDAVHAVRMAVAGSRAHLTPADVVVMDLQRQVTYDAPQDSRAFAREAQRAELTGRCRESVEAAVADIPGARVCVQVRDPGTARPETPSGVVAPPAGTASNAGGAASSRVPLTGRSGPNLRLEVPPAPTTAARPSMPDPARSPHRVDAVSMQLDVTVAIPSALVVTDPRQDHRSPRTRSIPHTDRAAQLRQFQSDARQRIAATLARALPTGVASNVTVQFDPQAAMPERTPAGSLPEGAVLSDGSLPPWLTALPSMSVAQMVPLSVLLVVVGFLIGRRVLFGRRPSPSEGIPALHGASRLGSGAARQNRSVVSSAASTSQDGGSGEGLLSGIDAVEWAPFAAREPAALIAGLLRLLSPDEVAKLIEQLSSSRQREVLALAPTAAISDHELELLRRRLVAQLDSSPRLVPRIGPRNRFAIGCPADSPASSRAPAASLDALSRADEESLRRLVESIPTETWSAALLAAPPKLRRRLTRICGDSARFTTPGDHRPLRLREIESAQQLILDEWRSLQSQREAAGRP